MAYGARLESVLGASPHGFESHILRKPLACLTKTNEQVSFQDTAGEACTNDIREPEAPPGEVKPAVRSSNLSFYPGRTKDYSCLNGQCRPHRNRQQGAFAPCH